jgi:hypothetical protein
MGSSEMHKKNVSRKTGGENMSQKYSYGSNDNIKDSKINYF